MQPFCFNPSTNRETLRDFNERVQEYCLETCATNIVAQCSGKYLFLKVFTAEDLEEDQIIPGTPTVMPAVRMAEAKDAEWEEQLIALIEQEEGKATEEDPVRDVIDINILQNGHDSTKAWIIATIMTGELDGDVVPEEGEEGEQNDPENDQPPGPDLSSPSVGFQSDRG